MFRKTYYLWQRTSPFLAACFSKRGLPSRAGRQLIVGKLRRVLLTLFPPLARYLRRVYGLEGGCSSCGASCNLLFQCPHWNAQTRLCGVYEDRPNICRYFPVTPQDIKDRDLVLLAEGRACGYAFKYAKAGSRIRVSAQTEIQT